MNARLRRRHRIATLALAALMPPALAVALSVRDASPTIGVIPPALGVAETGGAPRWSREDLCFAVPMRIRGFARWRSSRSSRCAIRCRPTCSSTGPPMERTMRLPDGAQLLGRLAGTEARRFALPAPGGPPLPLQPRPRAARRQRRAAAGRGVSRRGARLPGRRLESAEAPLRRGARGRHRRLSRALRRARLRAAAERDGRDAADPRASAPRALLLLHVILCIGPLCRLDRRFLPLLYNRRHLGVRDVRARARARRLRDCCSSTRSATSNPLVSVLASEPRARQRGQFPFQPFGVGGAAGPVPDGRDEPRLLAGEPHARRSGRRCTWASTLPTRCVLLHVALGVLQAETSPVLGRAARARLRRRDRRCTSSRRSRERAPTGRSRRSARRRLASTSARSDEIPEKRARIVRRRRRARRGVPLRRRASAALSNVCRTRTARSARAAIVDGCVVCPWHGYQYRPRRRPLAAAVHEQACRPTACASSRARAGRPARAAAGHRTVEPARIDGASGRMPACADDEFYVGYAAAMPPGARRASCGARSCAPRSRRRRCVAALLAAAQNPFAPSVFEYGDEREFIGLLRETPAPLLVVPAPRLHRVVRDDLELAARRATEPSSARQSWCAVSTAAACGCAACSSTATTRRCSTSCPARSRCSAPAPASPPRHRRARRRSRRADARGEIVDAKCHFGVMRPGQRQVAPLLRGALHRERRAADAAGSATRQVANSTCCCSAPTGAR